MALVSLLKLSKDLPLLAYRQISMTVSAALVLASIALYAFVGLNLGVDFQGGIKIAARFAEVPSLPQLRSQIDALNLGPVTIQTIDTQNDVLIILPAQEGDENANQVAVQTLKSSLGDAVADYRSTEAVGPTVSAELFQAGLMATVLSLLAIAAYVAFRFEWRFAVAALAALTHDVITTIGLFCLLQLEFNLGTVAAVLAIAGYSINDTVVVFDRVREEMRKFKQKSVMEILTIAVNRTLARTVVTSLTTLLALIALLAFGGPVIRDFSIALIWGVVIGTYSSIFLATPLLLLFNLRRDSMDREKPGDDGEAELLKRLASQGDKG